MRKQEFKKMRRGLGTSGTTLNTLTSESEGEQEQEVENLSEQIMKENFPNLVKEIDFQEAQSSKEIGFKEEHTKTHHN